MVHFRTKNPGLVVWIAEISSSPTGAADSGFRRLCEAPCSKPIEHGRYRLAYSMGNDSPLVVKDIVNLTREGALEAEIRSNREARIAGWVILGVGAATGMALLSVASVTTTHAHRNRFVVGGIAALACGPALGLPIALTSDTALAAEVALPRSTTNPSTPPELEAYRGLSWIGRF